MSAARLVRTLLHRTGHRPRPIAARLAAMTSGYRTVSSLGKSVGSTANRTADTLSRSHVPFILGRQVHCDAPCAKAKGVPASNLALAGSV